MMNPIQGLQQAFGQGSDDPIGIALQQRAKATYQQRQLEDPMQMQGHLFDPQWDTYLQALNEAGVDKFTGPSTTSSPIGTSSNQLQGYSAQPAQIAPYDSKQGGPFGAMGAGTGGIESRPPSNSFRLTEPSAPVAGLQNAQPKKKLGVV